MINPLIYILSTVILCANPALNQVKKASILVQVKGISNSDGNIEIGLYNKEEGFPKRSEAFKGTSVAASPDGISYTFNDVPQGTYAIAVWHDENSNKKLDRNFFGAPKEDYGFSQNKYGTFGPPDFKDVSFNLKEKDLVFIINIK